MTDEVRRPKRIRIGMRKRCSGRGFGRRNAFLYSFYRLLRILFITICFYFLPLIYLIYSNFAPVMIYRERLDNCETYSLNGNC